MNIDIEIQAYKEATRELAARLRRELGTSSLLRDIRLGIVPRTGRLSNGTEFQFHGRGVLCRTSGAEVDFDLDFSGEPLSRIDPWKLATFVKSRHPEARWEDVLEMSLSYCGHRK